MKINWNTIRFLLLATLVVFLFSFTKQRNQLRKLSKIEVEFLDEGSSFITLNTVNKLLIQNNDTVSSIDKETLVLDKMEGRLLDHPMIKNAEVFLTIDGVLGAKIIQRKPLVRVTGSVDYYLDEEGKTMPLSSVHSARVPLMTGTSSSDFAEVIELLKKINEDNFMKKIVVGLHLERDGTINMRLRKNNFEVTFGKPENIENKFRKLKAFYKKTKQDSTLFKYNLVNLQYKNQVVATKKINHGE